MATMLEPNKTKIAKRVIEIFEFFDSGKQKATVMDIVRRYGCPQSSTSELLSSLVEMGLLYKDPGSRAYSPTPRLATLGTSAQPEIIRDGRLFSSMDRLAHSTRSAVALFGMVGTCVQIFRWVPGSHASTRDLGCGASMPLSSSTAGLLMLATLPQKQAEKILWRLNAEAPAGSRFNPIELGECVKTFRRCGYASGVSGFAPGMNMITKLLPYSGTERPLAIGVIHAADVAYDTNGLVENISDCISDCVKTVDKHDAALPPLPVMMRSPKWPAVAVSSF